MARALYCLFLYFLLSLNDCTYASSNYNESLTELLLIKHNIDTNHSIHFQDAGDQMTPASTIFIQQFWKQYTKDIPVQILCLRFHVDRLGNFLGNYFDSIACALDTGTHFIGVKKDLKGHNPTIHDMFYDALPEIIVNPNPVNYSTAIINVQKICKCSRYCWLADHVWSRHIPYIREILNKGLQLHLSMKDKHDMTILSKGLHIDHTKDMLSVPINTILPLIPDFAIHYRCSDNLFGGMGLISFGSIIEKIPSEAKYIYIFTEGSRLKGRALESSAPIIIKALFDDLVSYFPNSIVVVKKGGNEITIWAQFAYANITYCSPSTYCFYPAIARTQTTYMPATDYIGAKEGSASGHVFIHPNYHWIKYPRLYNNFTKDTPVQDILNTLRMDLPIKRF